MLSAKQLPSFESFAGMQMISKAVKQWPSWNVINGLDFASRFVPWTLSSTLPSIGLSETYKWTVYFCKIELVGWYPFVFMLSKYSSG